MLLTFAKSTFLKTSSQLITESFFLVLKKNMVPRAGLEPARIYIRGILSPLRLPIPPSRHNKTVEAAPGFEPGIGVLQTPALPLGYAAR
jgi:hypothetical protein